MAGAPLERLVDQVRSAQRSKAPLDIRGGGTKAFYGGAPVGEPLDTAPLRGISSYEPTELVVTVRAGTPLAELEAALAEQGQCLPFEPPRFAYRAVAGAVTGSGSSSNKVGDASVTAPTGPVGGCDPGGGGSGGTVGGMVAAGLAGPARAAVGGVRDYVLGATLLNGRGEILSFGGQVIKNVAGYDVSRVLAGSMGILGVVCEVSLKVLPAPPATRTLRFEADQATAIRRVNGWSAQPLPLNASAWWDGMLVVRLSGARAAVEAAATRLGGEAVEATMAAAFWDGLRDHKDEFFVGADRAVDAGAGLWRLSVPATTAPLKLSGEQLLEWGGAQRWICTTAPPTALRDVAAAAGGHAVLFRSRDKAGGAFAPLKPPLDRIHRELKAAFDPDGLFNRGRLVPNL